MSEPMKPPQRLLEDPSVDGEVQDGLAELAASELPFDGAAGLAALKSALTQEAAAAGAGAAATSAGFGNAAWIVGSLAAAVVGGGLYALWPAAPEARTPERPLPAKVAAPQAPALEPAAAPVAAPQSKALPEREPAAVPTPSASPLEREVALTVRAKQLVDAQPRNALALLRKLDREHPGGALAEERAGLRVLALFRAGERARAQSERDAFLARYPQSPMRERLAQLDEAE
jgi:hypothetical protein